MSTTRKAARRVAAQPRIVRAPAARPVPPPRRGELDELPDAPPREWPTLAQVAAPVELLVEKPPPARRTALHTLATLLLIGIIVAGVGGCMATMNTGAPAAEAPTAAIAEPAAAQLAPAELPAPAVVGWWAPDGEPRAFAERPVIKALHARCGARTDIVLVLLTDDSQVWLSPADAAATPELIVGMPNDVCAGGL